MRCSNLQFTRLAAVAGNKVGQAFATGTAVVATRLACGDLPVQSGEHLLLADDPETFSANVVSLLKDPALRLRLAASARRFVEENYDWDIVAASMERLLVEAARRRGDTRFAPWMVDEAGAAERFASRIL